MRNRKKRSLSFLAGAAAGATITHFIESKDMTDCKKNIELLKENEDHLLRLIKNHTSILETTANILRNEDNRIANYFRAFTSDLSELRASIRSIEKWTNQQHTNSTYDNA